jgi:formate dehydrogenase major subunit
VAGLATTFGSGAMTNSIEEIAEAACILAIGTNTTWAHPVIGLRVKRAVRDGATLIVANPKRIDLCRFADFFLQLRPGTDVALLLGMMRVVLDEGLADEPYIAERTENIDALKVALADFPLEKAAEITGIDAELIARATRAYAGTKPASILYAMGVTQHTHGTDNVIAIANLALLTGNVGRYAGGVNPLRGQNNVQGACDMGALPDVFPGYQKIDVPEANQKFQKAWGAGLSSGLGLTHTEIMDAAIGGNVKAIYLMGENPLLSEANLNHTRKAFEKADFVICQDIFLSETAQVADIVFPAASFAEKNGTFTNTERRVQRVRKVIEPVGDAKPDWWIICEIAKRMGVSGFDFESPEQIFEEIAAVTPAYGGISYARIEKAGLQWPCPTQDHPGTPYLHKEKFMRPGEKGKFTAIRYRASAELPDADYPLMLTTDRSLFHYHTGTMTMRVEGLKALHDHERLLIHPDDAEKIGIADGQEVVLISRRGRLGAEAKVTDICPPGVVSMTFHFASTPTNVLTNNAVDPVAKIPETKICAVRIERSAPASERLPR